jgi:hypothetical protein
MATKLKTKDPLAFLANYSCDDLKQSITSVVGELAKEYANLHEAQERPRPLSDADKRLLATERKDLTTVDLAKWRIAYWEDAQDRLWHWYRTKCGQATESAVPGGSPLG